MAEETKQLQYKCPCCGGSIEFDSASQNMKCPYCDTEFDVETLAAYDEILQGDKGKTDDTDPLRYDSGQGDSWQADEAENMAVWSCKSCGGEIVTDKTTGAASCPWCGSPVVMGGHFAGGRRPDLVIPFRLDKAAAREGLKKHLSGKKLLPKIFKDENHIDQIRGMYVPVWLYDTEAEADVRFHCTRVRTWADRNYRYTETKHYAVQRSGSMAFADIPVDGSSKMADEIMESIEPFDISGAVDFQTAYLAGYLADTYDVSAEECAGRANQRVKASTEEAVAQTVRGKYDTVTPEQSTVRYRDTKIRYALYPVWVLNTTWQDKNYLFAMNGQTGKLVGDLPMDKGAWFRWWLIGSGISTAVILLLAALFFGL